MAQIVRLIWRLDFDVGYAAAYLNKRGSVLKVLSDTVPDFWENLGEGTIPNSFVGVHHNDSEYRAVSVEVVDANGSLEWAAGTDLAKALQSDAFRGIDRIVHEVLRVCEVRVVHRAGLRLFCADTFADAKGEPIHRVSELIARNFRENTAKEFGQIGDIGLTFEGRTTDDVGFRATFGPFAQKNVDLVTQLKRTEEQYKLLNSNDLFFDIDLFENDISFSEHSLFRWSSTKVTKALDFIGVCRQIGARGKG